MSRRTALIGAALLAALPALATSATPPGSPAAIAARWQKHELTFTYHGFTSFYTCDGLEEKVRQILLHFGARKGVQAQASGCAYGPSTPSPNAWVTVKFESLAPAPEGQEHDADTVAASWQPVELRPRRPSSMGEGECEIVEQLKPVITAGFALQDLDYRARCIPHQISMADYGVSGKVLRATPGR